jgi:hypothetical protein
MVDGLEFWVNHLTFILQLFGINPKKLKKVTQFKVLISIF